MANIIVDSYSESNYADYYAFLYPGANIILGQSFTATAGKLAICKFYMMKVASPTGSIYGKLYAHSGTYGTSSKPTGSALATSNAYDVSTLPTSMALITFTFTGANQYALVNGTKYCIHVLSNIGNSTNKVAVAYDASTPTHGGNMYLGDAENNTTAYAANDTIFYVYKLPPSGGAFLLNMI